MHLVDDATQAIARLSPVDGALVVGLAAFVKYVAPIIPGDLVVALGAFMVARHVWSFALVFGAEMIGSTLGFMTVYLLARKLAHLSRPPDHWLERMRVKAGPTLERFRRHGAWYLALNRFIPSVRVVFFWAAGFARLPAWQVLVAGAFSAAAWNAALFALGVLAGERWSEMMHGLQTYGTTMTVLLVAVAVALFARWRWWRRSTARLRR